MNSKCVGKININKERLFSDLTNIVEEDYLLDYSEYTIGFWRSMVLINDNGKSSNGEVLEYHTSGQYTSNINKLPYIKKIIEDNFDINKIKLARIVTIKKNGIILPHVDYLTFKKPRLRYNIPLISNPMAISIEGTEAYSMRSGEVWDLDASKIHSAGNFSEEDRVSLIIDFDCEMNKDCAVKNKEIFNYDRKINFIDRASFDSEYLNCILNLSKIINEYNYRDILSIVSKIPFFSNVDLITVFDMMEDICTQSKQKNLLDSIQKTKELFLHTRNDDMVEGIY